YRFWEEHGFFHARVNPAKKPYTIVIPPPNVTGVLHMGHILNNTLQDAFIRYKRMKGYEACWIPGTDHAGIATQNVVEKALMKEGKTRHDLGREKFVERVWEWKKQYGGVIIRQLRTLGCSCDWERERFTMDETLSTAVKEVFVRLFDDGLIYRGNYIVNWCPKDHTAISDDEVNYTDQQGKLYYIKYPIPDSAEAAIVATTRPETMFGDVAVAVHPADERYRHLIGKTAILPLANRPIPIIADEYVDRDFGTGMVKITPAHDPNDYWVGQRHNLPQPVVMDISARMNDIVPPAYRGLDRYEARKRVLADLQAQDLLVKQEDHASAVGRCYRCDTVIEPYLSEQWFVRMKPLAEPALKVVLDGTIKFYPERWVKVYEHWMTNVRDWCISRQLWWGHRIPVYYAADGRFTAARSEEEARKRLNLRPDEPLRQDEDVLDTWFSSWLWPFSVHDWPQHENLGKAQDLAYFYPTDTLVTAPEIIFFWVARMIMAGLRFAPTFTGSDDPKKNIPFRDVYFTSIVRDAKGRKMSKSLGNSPEPLDLIAEYGADAVRFTILYLAPLGQDIIYAKEKNEIGRNFANKIWNAGRFLLMNRDQIGEAPKMSEFNTEHLDLADRWILSRFHSALLDIEKAMEVYEINRVTKDIYDFFWHDYCDWYLEMIKSRLYGDEPTAVKQAVLARAIDLFDGALRMLHPIMPFVTEELWQNIRRRDPQESIMRAPMVEPDGRFINKQVEQEMAFVQSIIESVRTIRGEMSIAPSKEVSLIMKLRDGRDPESIRRYDGYLKRLARVRSLSFITDQSRPKLSATAVVQGDELFVPLEGLIDIEVEKARLQREIARISGLLKSTQAKLENPNFVEKAPKDVVEKEKEKLETFTETLTKLQRNYQALL
ncbi:MAG TPA: valine--tRNA ligase, partial [Bacteroidota bacterium]|nr:valine--tRNA ligase [Bacteroidota bacterium]